jgi:hypothetical protein
VPELKQQENQMTSPFKQLTSGAALALLFAAAGLAQPAAPVQVKNNTLQAIPIRDMGNNPQKAVAHIFTFSIPNGTLSNLTTSGYYVPAGKRLVIEHVTASATAPNAIDLNLQISTILDGKSFYSDYGHQHRMANPGGFRLSSANPSRLYADGGTWVQATARVTPGQGIQVAACFYGYLVDMPLLFEVAP